MEIKDKVVLITGGSSGLGAAVASACLAAGAQVVVADRAITDQNGSGGCFQVRCDVTSESDAAACIAAVQSRYGALHVLVQCAGIAPAERLVGRHGPIAMSSFESVVAVNLCGTVRMMRLAAEMMQSQPAVSADQERGVIINTASIAAFEGQIGQGAYAASKGGVAALTLPAAREFASHGIRVMCVAPGVMQTPMMAGMPEGVSKQLGETVVFPKRLGRSEEFAQLVTHIVANGYLNGSVIRLDGGLRMAPR